MGCYLEDLAPRTGADALQEHVWPADIRGGLSMVVVFEIFHLWDILHEVILSQEANVHVWRLYGSRQFSSKSSYRAFFSGSISFEPW
jgi:hypothetical protein